MTQNLIDKILQINNQPKTKSENFFKNNFKNILDFLSLNFLTKIDNLTEHVEKFIQNLTDDYINFQLFLKIDSSVIGSKPEICKQAVLKFIKPIVFFLNDRKNKYKELIVQDIKKQAEKNLELVYISELSESVRQNRVSRSDFTDSEWFPKHSAVCYQFICEKLKDESSKRIKNATLHLYDCCFNFRNLKNLLEQLEAHHFPTLFKKFKILGLNFQNKIQTSLQNTEINQKFVWNFFTFLSNQTNLPNAYVMKVFEKSLVNEARHFHLKSYNSAELLELYEKNKKILFETLKYQFCKFDKIYNIYDNFRDILGIFDKIVYQHGMNSEKLSQATAVESSVSPEKSYFTGALIDAAGDQEIQTSNPSLVPPKDLSPDTILRPSVTIDFLLDELFSDENISQMMDKILSDKLNLSQFVDILGHVARILKDKHGEFLKCKIVNYFESFIGLNKYMTELPNVNSNANVNLLTALRVN